jgi:hypothetical protein
MVSAMTAQSAEYPLSSVVTAMIAFPRDSVFTKPLADTVATLSALLDQLTFLFVALAGLTVATNHSLPPTSMFVLALLKETPVT